MRNHGCKSLMQPEKESTLPTIVLEDSLLLPLQPWGRCRKGACLNRGCLLHADLRGSKVECYQHWELEQNVSRLKIGRLEEEEERLSHG